MFMFKIFSHKYALQLLLSTAIMLFSGVSIAAIYKWVDEQGNVHYGQQRPADTSVEKMNVQMHAPRDASSYKKPGQKDAEENTDEAASNENKPEKAAESAADKKHRMAACAQARKKLSTMQAAGRVRGKDKDGNITYLSDEQKNAQMKSTRDLIAKHCK